MEYRFYKVKNTIISLLLISVEVIFVNSASSAGKRYLATLMWQKKEKKNRSHFYFEPSPKYFGLAVGLSHFYSLLEEDLERNGKVGLRYCVFLSKTMLLLLSQKKKKDFLGWLIMFFLLFLGLKVNGGWSGWSIWSGCAAGICAGNQRIRTRTCTNPIPSKDGKYCVGESSQQMDCMSKSVFRRVVWN